MQNGLPAKNGLRIITTLVLACCAMLQSTCYWAFHPEGSQRAPKASVRKGAEVVVTLIEGFRRGLCNRSGRCIGVGRAFGALRETAICRTFRAGDPLCGRRLHAAENKGTNLCFSGHGFAS